MSSSDTEVHGGFKIQNWYPKLTEHSFPAVFVLLEESEKQALTADEPDAKVVGGLLLRLQPALKQFSGPRFISVDTVSPTDTERFQSKRGAVHSAESAWRILRESQKVREAAGEGKVSCICVRPFRRMQPAREFRLFVKNGRLSGMSQYWLIRHFRRLQGRLDFYWTQAADFIDDVSGHLPVKDAAVDIYFTSGGKILIVDINPWGAPTNPLMLDTWDRDWGTPSGCVIVPPPHVVSGDVNVSF
ncbi:MAG: hypothetical protein BWY31_00117 [Lentisphaerae bacterium ADurb.Bin242]|nr:MAG: hypothetical protein BWY31_00117 [Lentisphaerae bacterium ADurb.Bin242]